VDNNQVANFPLASRPDVNSGELVSQSAHLTLPPRPVAVRPAVLGEPRGEAPRPAAGTATLRLSGSDRAECARARRFTEQVLGAWELDTCRDDALTVVSELAANAVLHGSAQAGQAAGQGRAPADGATCDVWLKLTRRPAHLVCAVTDPSAGVPAAAHAPTPHASTPHAFTPLNGGPRTTDPCEVDALAEQGRGLLLVEALSEHWGWTRYVPRGKTVWAMLATGARG
jgi:hypothetical protein